MSKQVNIGVIGAGWPAWQHIKGYQKLENVKVLALCDINKEILSKTAKEYNIPKTFTKCEDMLKLKEIDAISVCTPNFLHVPQVIASLNAGKHVICEKPLSVSAEEACKIIGPLKKSKKKFMIAQVKRFANESKYLKKLINNNELGNIYYSKIKYLRRAGIPGIGSWFTTKKYSGGGSLIDCGVHVLDLTWWLMGCPKPVEIFGSTYAKFGPKGLRDSNWSVSKDRTKIFDVEDLSTGIIKFENGASLFIETSWAMNIKEDSQVSCLLYGTDGGAELSPLKLLKYIDDCPNCIEPKIPENNIFDEEIKHFVDCIVNDKKPTVTLEHGIRIMKMMDGIYKSAKTGKSVTVK
ncbi:MAG: hypothetical protein A2539_07550 [Elusimicrobia bacterium RIFOXYD2_FULL_34_15]|nr:MAG: hypothetical protein A2539_07550 [Elusimicrobia bacterium RIFOXYD2_FULL_34_15]